VLRQARRFLLRVEAPNRPPLSGDGRITAEPLGEGLVWREQGRWRTGALAGAGFHNATAWQPAADGAELSHLRRGDHAPTFLVRLGPAGPARWESVAPHHCGADRYSAWLELAAGKLRLGWEVASPSDPYRLVLEITGASTSPLETDALGT